MVTALVILFWSFNILQFLVVLANLAFREHLSAGKRSLANLSVLIPARNESGNICNLLNDLIQLSSPPLEIIVCDDHSTDDTARLVLQISRQHPQVRLINSAPLPSGWLGKNFACHQLAQHAKGEYLLFLDADVRIQGNTLESILYFTSHNQLGLFSVFPRQIIRTEGEKQTVPLMNYILLTLLPLPLIRKVPDQSALAAANGQFMLFRTSSYHRLEPHRQVRKERAEDIAISRYYKKEGIPVACLTGICSVSCRMYHSAKEAVDGLARSLPFFFGGSLTLAVLFWLFTTIGIIWVGVYTSLPSFLFYLFVWLTVKACVSYLSCQSIVGNLFRSYTQQLFFTAILYRAFRNRKAGQLTWKGRII